jgi:hypothetical protein
MTRIIGPTGSRRRRRFLIAPLLVVSAVALLFVAGAQAVHGENFQLDGDVLASTTTNVGGVTQNIDWDSLINADGTVKDPLPANFDEATFDKDFLNNGTTFITSDTTTFATGSKDTLPIADWQCNFDNNVNSKIDVMNAYATTYTAGGEEFLYFALERNTNTGTADVGFWFLQGEAGCETTGGAADFSGAHQDGDLLVVSEFTGGGTVSTINVYRWNGDDATGELGETAVASGVDCRNVMDPNDEACGAANRVAITTPWLTAAKTLNPQVGNNLPIAQFFEGGVNLTQSGLGGKCFNTFIGDTRSSAELNATLFDYSLGELGVCETDVETTPVDNAGTPIPAGGLLIPADPADAAILVRDRAVITVTGADTFTATLTFHLCGPFPAGSSDLCGTGGVLVDTQNLTTDGTFTSAAATVTSAGRYCWRADFSGDEDAGVPAGSDSRASECFVVNPRQPVLTTQAGAGPVILGNPVTDTATLTNTAHDPGTGGPAGSTDGSINPATLGDDADGTITFTLYKDNACTVLATGTGTNPQTVSVSGDGTYGPVSFIPDAPGTYHWVASYSGDLPNTLASGPSACLDENEDVEVIGRSFSETAQDWLPNDTATITGDTNLNGTLTFQLYTGDNCGVTSGAPVPGQSYSFTLTNAPSPAVRSTTNTTFKVTAANEGAYSWLVHYVDTFLTDPPDRCETSTVSITD